MVPQAGIESDIFQGRLLLRKVVQKTTQLCDVNAGMALAKHFCVLNWVSESSLDRFLPKGDCLVTGQNNYKNQTARGLCKDWEKLKYRNTSLGDRQLFKSYFG